MDIKNNTLSNYNLEDNTNGSFFNSKNVQNTQPTSYPFNYDFSANIFNRSMNSNNMNSQSFNSQQFNQNPNYMFNKVSPPIIQPNINNYNQMGFNMYNDYNSQPQSNKDVTYSRNGQGNQTNPRDNTGRDIRENPNYYQKPIINNLSNNINFMPHLQNLSHLNNHNQVNHNLNNNNDSYNGEQNGLGTEKHGLGHLRENNPKMIIDPINLSHLNKPLNSVQNYTDMNDEELARHCYVLAKDQGGCRFLQKKAEESKDFTNQYLYPNVIYINIITE